MSKDGMAYGGRITCVDFVMWPFVGLLPILAMAVPGPRWVAFALLAFAGLMGAGVGLTLSGVTDERSWVTGGRIQLPLILGAFVMAELTWFASAYWLTSQGTPSSFSAPLTCIDAIYFSLTTYTTTGFGDIFARSQGSRALVSLEMITALLTLVVLVATAVTKAFTQRR